VHDRPLVDLRDEAVHQDTGRVGQIEPYAHELSLYRDSELVWQGPVTRTVENRTTFTVEAKDVTEWLARCVNTTLLR
jgi:hypothetical protein